MANGLVRADTREHRLILTGPGVTVRWDDPTRKTRSGEKVRPPFLKGQTELPLNRP